MSARQLLLAAAGSARSESGTAPDPNAFVYTRSKEVGIVQTDDGKGKAVVARRYEDVREAWLSVDGRRDGAVTPSGDPDKLLRIESCSTAANSNAPQGGQGGRIPCRPRPAYLPDLPTRPEATLTYLRTREDGTPAEDDREAFGTARTVLQERLIKPQARAAIFEAMADLKGVEVVQGVVTVTGRAGVAIGMVTNTALREEIIFDPATYEVIGSRDTALTAEAGVPVGTALYACSILEMSVVDAVKHRPDGTWRKGEIEG